MTFLRFSTYVAVHVLSLNLNKGKTILVKSILRFFLVRKVIERNRLFSTSKNFFLVRFAVLYMRLGYFMLPAYAA